MRKSKFLSILIALSMVLTFVLMPIRAQEEPADYELFTNGPTLGGEVIEISFTNNTQQEVTLSGQIDVMVALQGQGWFAQWERESINEELGDESFGGQDQIVVPAGGDAVIARLAPGNGFDWRSFDTAEFDMQIDVWLLIDGIDTRLQTDWHEITPVDILFDVSFSVNGPVEYFQGEDFDTSMIISATNNSAENITIEGPFVINPNGIPQKEREQYDLIGGDQIIIPAGDTVEIVEILPGPPTSWRNFYFPQINDFIGFFNITYQDTSYIFQHNNGRFCIVGEVEDTEIIAILNSVEDNEDATATVNVSVSAQEAVWGVRIVDNSCEFYQEEPLELGPVSDLTKEHFLFFKRLEGGVQELIGNVLNSFETEAGKYEIIWSHEDGTHEVFVEVSNEETGMWGIVNTNPDGWDDLFDVIVSTQSRPVVTTQNQDTGKYEGSLDYKTAKMTFTADEPVDVEINYKRKGETLTTIPDNMQPTGIYMDINIASGTLPPSATILLEIDYSRDDIPVGMNEENLRLYRYNEETMQWDILPNQTVDTENKIISVILTGFSEFGVFEASDEDLADLIDEDADEDEVIDEDDEELTEEMGDNAPIIALIIAVILSVGAIAFMLRKTKRS